MNTFPTLSTSPDIQGFFRRRPAETVRVESFASGKPCLNKLFTFLPISWSGTLSFVSQEDMEAVDAFYLANCDKEFYWLNEQDDTVYEVCFTRPPDIQTQDDDNKEMWKIGLELLQTSPTETSTDFLNRRFYGGDAMINVVNLAAGADISDMPVFVAMDAMTLNGCRLLTQGTPAGIDNSNTVVITLTVNGNVLLTKTYNTATQPPTNDEEDLTSLLDSDYVALEEGDVVKLSVTQGVTANMPAFVIGFRGYF